MNTLETDWLLEYGTKLSRRLRLIADLTVEKALLMARQAEEVAQQITQQEQQVSLSVQAVKRGGYAKKGGRPQAEWSERPQQSSYSRLQVIPLRLGETHKRNQMPSYGFTMQKL